MKTKTLKLEINLSPNSKEANWLRGLLRLGEEKRELMTIFINNEPLTILTNGEITQCPSEIDKINLVNYYPSIIAEKLASVPNELLSEFLITS